MPPFSQRIIVQYDQYIYIEKDIFDNIDNEAITQHF